MPNQERHQKQAKHNRRFLDTISVEYPDWRITVMMYVCLHGCRAYISGVRPGYDAPELNYSSLQRILQTDVPDPQPDLAFSFNQLVKMSYKSRYYCQSDSDIEKVYRNANQAYEATIKKLEELGIVIMQ